MQVRDLLLPGEPTTSVDFETLVKALGVEHVRKVDPYNLKETMEVIKEEVERDAPSVIITANGPCMLHRREKRKFEHPFYAIDSINAGGVRCVLRSGARRSVGKRFLRIRP